MEAYHTIDRTDPSQQDERLHLHRLKQIATEELSRHNLSKTAWRKALDQGNQNEIRARSFYIDYRVEELRREKAATESDASSRISSQVLEKKKYENTVFMLFLVTCLVTALIFGQLV